MTEWYEKPPVTPGREFLILVGLWVLGLVAGTLITMPVWMMMTGESPLSMATSMTKPEYRPALLVVQSLSSVFAFFFSL